MMFSLLLALVPQAPLPPAPPQAAQASGGEEVQSLEVRVLEPESAPVPRPGRPRHPRLIGNGAIYSFLLALCPQAPLPAVPPEVVGAAEGGAPTLAGPGAPRGAGGSLEGEARAVAAGEALQNRALLIHGGRIRLGDAKDGVVEALLIEDGRVVAAGSEASLAARLPVEGVRRLDLDGAVAVPGLQDAHGHVEEYGAFLEMIDLRGLASLEAVIAVVAEQARSAPPGTWLVGRGWDQNLWAEGVFPDHHSLSLAVPEHPVFLYRVDGHAALVNQKALEIAELDGAVDNISRLQGGRLRVDEELHATGMLLDTAMRLVTVHLPQPDQPTRERWILHAQDELLALGLTCIHDMGISPSTLKIYEQLLERGLLRIRIVAYLSGNEGLTAEQLKRPALPPDERELFTVAGVKFIADGGLGSWGAAMLADYSDRPGERGYLLLTEERLTALVHAAWQAGLQPAVHAEGDAANRMALDVYERMLQVDEGFAALRPRIEHAQVISTRDFPRFPGLGVIPSMQPIQASADRPWVAARLGKRRTRGAFAWRSLAPGIVPLAFGSDFPAQNPDPLAGIHAARTRQEALGLTSDSFLAEERLDGPAALCGYTYGAAHAARQEQRRGRLTPGYAADLTILDIDPAECRPEALLEAKVLLTVINGEVVYQR